MREMAGNIYIKFIWLEGAYKAKLICLYKTCEYSVETVRRNRVS